MRRMKFALRESVVRTTAQHPEEIE